MAAKSIKAEVRAAKNEEKQATKRCGWAATKNSFQNFAAKLGIGTFATNPECFSYIIIN